MGALKGPGPDGFQATLYQRAWNIVGDDVSSSMLNILEEKKLQSWMADTLLVLIPKKEKPENIRQFHPISLYNMSFKLVTKVLVSRLKIMDKIMSPNQRSFILRHQITDNIIICQEMIDTLKHKTRSRGMIIKIDLGEGLQLSRMTLNQGDVGRC